MDEQKLRAALEDYCTKEHIFGSLRVTQRDEILFSQHFGYADLEAKTSFDERSAFSFYSLSKPLCAIGLLKLVDAERVDLDAHPGRYVAEAAAFDERVTIRQLLYHTSGLPDFELCEDTAPAFAPYDPATVRGQLPALAACPQLFIPGTGARYANINFLLCALIIENVTGISYADYMHSEIFAPLGMRTAVVDRPGLTIPHRVTGYEMTPTGPAETAKAYDWMLGAGDIVGTVDDVYCLNKAIKHRLLLTETTWQQVLTPSPLNSMGMGCTISRWHDRLRITHNGGHTGFRTLHIQLPEDDFDIIFLSNSGYGDARAAVSEMVYDAFYGDDDNAGAAVAMDTGYIPRT